jgi:hypothetical protein
MTLLTVITHFLLVCPENSWTRSIILFLEVSAWLAQEQHHCENSVWLLNKNKKNHPSYQKICPFKAQWKKICCFI